MSLITSFRTREVRWFLKEPFHKADRWFEKLPSSSCTLESREDIYLVLPGRNDLGVKFRESRLELKYRLEESGPQEIAPGITGTFESWEKLGFPSDPESMASALPVDSRASRMPVLKRRRATIIGTKGTTETFHPLGTPVEAGVQFEYTELQVFGSSWLTVGLEWSDAAGVTLPERFLSGLLSSEVFKVSSSMGYPEFLRRMLRQKEGF
ncbi:MAG: hypothetical protein P8Z38_06815 [Robiginitalea sp.]